MVSRHSPAPAQEVRAVRQVQLVGRRLRRLRKERRLDQEQLAAKVGIQVAELARMEKDVHRVSLDVLVRILAVLDVGAEELFAEPAERPTAAAPLWVSGRSPK
jgi:transcriptional regulator with XRE-family HTH domain